jgi:hypothetical protein
MPRDLTWRGCTPPKTSNSAFKGPHVAWRDGGRRCTYPILISSPRSFEWYYSRAERTPARGAAGENVWPRSCLPTFLDAGAVHRKSNDRVFLASSRSFEWYMPHVREKSFRVAVIESVRRRHVFPFFSATTTYIKNLTIGFGRARRALPNGINIVCL